MEPVLLIACSGLAFVLTVFLAVLTGRMSESKGFSYSFGFWLCWCASPLLAWLILMALPDNSKKNAVNPSLQLEIEMELARQKIRECPLGEAGIM